MCPNTREEIKMDTVCVLELTGAIGGFQDYCYINMEKVLIVMRSYGITEQTNKQMWIFQMHGRGRGWGKSGIA